MTISLNNELLDTLMPYCRKHNKKPHEVIKELILNHLGANEECQNKKPNHNH